MSSLSKYIKEIKAEDRAFFYGDDVKATSNKYFKFSRVKDEDNIIIITDNIRTVKDNNVLIVGSNKCVYLKDWQIRSVHNFYEGINSYAVKLNRKYFKVYTFHSDFWGFEGMEEESFDDLLNVAKEQDAAGMEIADGHMG